MMKLNNPPSFRAIHALITSGRHRHNVVNEEEEKYRKMQREKYCKNKPKSVTGEHTTVTAVRLGA